MSAQIKHLVVLMMENRSLDHMLGYTKSDKYPLDGLDGTQKNLDSTGELVPVNDEARYSGDLTIDPRHDFEDVMEQMFGTYPPPAGQQADMSGFVRNYERYTGGPATATPVMNCFAPKNLPILATLARSYAVCDHWFCSFPDLLWQIDSMRMPGPLGAGWIRYLLISWAVSEPSTKFYSI